MRRSYVQIDGVLYEKGTVIAEPVAPTVMPDFAPFKSNDGAEIRGRAHWREHLKATDGIEMGMSDIKAAEARHASRKSAYAERMARATAQTQAVDVPYREGQEVRRSSVAANVLNRLHGRPTPDRKTVIKIALEEARRRR